MICPNCAKPSEEAVEECPACGLIFAKFKARSVEQPAPAASTSAGSGIAGISVGIVLFILLFGGYWFYHDSEAPPGAASEVTFRPELYKPQILALEAALYTTEPASAADGETISNNAGRIAGAIFAKHQQNPMVRDISVEFGEYSIAVAGTVEAKQELDAARLDWRRQWEALRAKRFKPAKWLHASAAVAAEPPSSVPAVPRAPAP